MRLLCVLSVAALVTAQDRPVRLTVGGEVRERYEYFENPVWGLQPQDGNGYLLHRYMLHADLHLGERLRFFGELKSGLENGRTGGPRRPDEDRLDVHQAFVEAQLTTGLGVRAGRQEVSLGAGRLASIRDGPNVRQSFDGGRLTFESRGWKIDALALRPAETNRGIFDDSPNHTQSLWGVYATGSARGIPGKLDLYYLGLDRRSHRYEEATAREQRHSVGVRLFDKSSAWDHDYEAVWQFGSFGPAAIRAWTVASDTGHIWKEAPWRPRLGCKGDIASGDRSPSDRRLGTFNALYPKGAYFSQSDLLGPYNLMDVHPSLTLNVARSVSVTPDADFFWRHSTRDGIYDVPGNMLVSGRNVSARYIGAHASVSVAWQATRKISLETQFLRFFPGEFLKEAGLGRAVNFVGVWGRCQF
jgi:hypothetical protein